MQHYRFECGCSFPVLKESNDSDILPLLDFDVDNINLDCNATWKLLGKGITKGVFQLESQLGKQWTKKLKPEHIEHLAALGALLRPGCLRAIDERHQCSMTELYCRRKNGDAPVEYIHDSLRLILEPTFGVLTYQEQAMEIARILAGFTLQEADELRKAIGKKLAEEMAKVKIKFMEGARRLQIASEEQAVEIFGWIEKSQRYSFNKSHAVSYGINGYISAFLKTHFPVYFYTSWLFYAKDKQDPQQEIKELVNDAKLMDVQVLSPDICNGQKNFSTDGKIVTFGLSDVKGIGEAQVDKMTTAIQSVTQLLGKDIQMWTWYELLVHLTPLLSNTVVTRLISVGAMRAFSNQRALMLAEYEKYNSLTKKEQEWIRIRSLNPYAKASYPIVKTIEASPNRQSIFDTEEENPFSWITNSKEEIDFLGLPTFTNLVEALKAAAFVKSEGGAAANYRRKEVIESAARLLENPITPYEDLPHEIAWNEENLLGIALSCNKVDGCDISGANCTCKELLSGREGLCVVAVQVESVRTITVKNGKQAGAKMAFLTVMDSSCAVEMIAFPDAWRSFSSLLSEGNTVTIQARKDNKKDSIIIDKVAQI